MEEDLWYMKQRSRVLQELRRQISPYWDDEAAKQMNFRYLNPHQDDDEKMIAGLDQQHKATDRAVRHIATCEEHALRIEELSVKVNEYISFATEDIQNSYVSIEQYREQLSLSKSLLPEIDQLILHADDNCDGVPVS